MQYTRQTICNTFKKEKGSINAGQPVCCVWPMRLNENTTTNLLTYFTLLLMPDALARTYTMDVRMKNPIQSSRLREKFSVRSTSSSALLLPLLLERENE